MEDAAVRARHGTPTGVLRDADRSGRALRVSAHPDADRVVLSTWQDTSCVSTVRLDRAEVVELLAALGAALLPPPGPGGHQGTTP
ncbi:hypothetical protein MO973_06360 [Paenibacillus sp. TRM 82003]|uniref:hypothetical protein n=1 Tax=Kineococcus sp. TRM81007 TaxID=2925831 RepID=UPI001F59201C|nr:hypothetical protein [Kineococcus sp. TRM81007]MCI2237498.1 hypothetical protein [Kineococcus sp. TRM81007]MCI3919851.1 hypothetical protein [Paenibacillus sp. TRM 82003]